MTLRIAIAATLLACGSLVQAKPPAPLPVATLKGEVLDRIVFASLDGARAEGKSMTLKIASTAFASDGAIPAVHTCEGKDLSPPLSWSGAPAGTRSFALIVDDPDAPDPAAPAGNLSLTSEM